MGKKPKDAANNISASSSKNVISRADHTISRKKIPDNVLKILHRLNKAGFEAYLVGGCVRDLLLGHSPKDFDIATDALPEEVKKLFRNCRLIGKRFRLAHIYFKQDIMEVATFRGDHDQSTKGGMIMRDNVYGNMEEDAFRRDFTINALYYTTKDFSVADYTNGMADLEQGLVRLIGDPETRFKEDPVRILRAIRFISKLDFEMHQETAKPIKKLSQSLALVPSARLFHEALKIFHGGYALPCFKNLIDHNLLSHLLPDVDRQIKENHPFTLAFIENALSNTDERIANHKTASPAFLFAMLLWYPTLQYLDETDPEFPHQIAFDEAMQASLKKQTQLLCIPKRLSHSIKDIWRLQPMLEKMPRHHVARIYHHPRFRAAYDLMLLRNEAGENLETCCKWWTDFINSEKSDQEHMVGKLVKTRKKRRRRKPSNKS